MGILPRRPMRGLLTATVTEIEDLSARVRRLRLSGPELQGFAWIPGQKIKLRAGPRLRSYTPARVDPVAGWVDVVFFLHGNGPASDWARQARGGEPVELIGPANSMPPLDSVPDWVCFLGDETAIGLAMALLASLPDTCVTRGAIELDAVDAGAVAAAGLPLTVVHRSHTHGAALVDWLDQTSFPPGRGVFWLSGEAGSVLALKQALLARGIEPAQLRSKPYWSTQGHAHRKRLQRRL